MPLVVEVQHYTVVNRTTILQSCEVTVPSYEFHLQVFSARWRWSWQLVKMTQRSAARDLTAVDIGTLGLKCPLHSFILKHKHGVLFPHCPYPVFTAGSQLNTLLTFYHKMSQKSLLILCLTAHKRERLASRLYMLTQRMFSALEILSASNHCMGHTDSCKLVTQNSWCAGNACYSVTYLETNNMWRFHGWEKEKLRLLVDNCHIPLSMSSRGRGLPAFNQAKETCIIQNKRPFQFSPGERSSSREVIIMHTTSDWWS